MLALSVQRPYIVADSLQGHYFFWLLGSNYYITGTGYRTISQFRQLVNCAKVCSMTVIKRSQIAPYTLPCPV